MMTLRASDVVMSGVTGVLVGLLFGAATGTEAPPTPPAPVTRVTVVTVPTYVPAGVEVCPEEDSCRLDYADGRWVIIPGGDR